MPVAEKAQPGAFAGEGLDGAYALSGAAQASIGTSSMVATALGSLTLILPTP
jgi:hypothetical protein